MACTIQNVNPLDSKEIRPGNQPRIFIGRTDAEAPILCPPEAKTGQEEKGATVDERVGWHH